MVILQVSGSKVINCELFLQIDTRPHKICQFKIRGGAFKKLNGTQGSAMQNAKLIPVLLECTQTCVVRIPTCIQIYAQCAQLSMSACV